MPRQMLLSVVCGRCYSHFVYICLGWCYCLWLWQMLLPILPQVLLMADVIAKMSYLYCNHQCWYVVWQMLLPSGRWNGHFNYNAGWCYCQVADGMATTGLEVGRCYCHVADGIATGSYYFSLSSEVLNRASSHMWGRWYLPMFLFRDGLLTLMYRASLMALMRFCSSLPTMLKFS